MPAFSEIEELFNNNVRAITETDNKLLWFGTDAGLYAVKVNEGKASIIQNPDLHYLNVWSLVSGNDNKLWIGTYGQGLRELNIKTNKLSSWKIDNPGFNPASFAYVKTILEDNKGMIWIGFWGGGLARLNTKTKKVDHWRNEKNNPSSLSYNNIWTLFEDRKGRIWIGTNGGGLDLFMNKMQNGFHNWNTSGKKNKA